MRSCTFRIAASMIALLVFSRAVEAGYGRINDYLIKTVNSNDVASNIAAASDWLKGIKSKPLAFLSIAQPVSDLKKFTALQLVIDDTRCDGVAHGIMQQNEEAVALYKLDDEEKLFRRVDEVMFKLFKDHAKKCTNVHPIIYRLKKQHLEEEIFKRVEIIAKKLMENDGFTKLSDCTPTRLFSLYVLKSVSVRRYIGKGIFQNALISSIGNEPNLRYVPKDPKRFTGNVAVSETKLVEDHLLNPCRRFVAEFGPDLFIPAKFDARFYQKLSEGDQDYYLGWSYFVICQALMEHNSVVSLDVVTSG